jgi:hypothetical protein
MFCLLAHWLLNLLALNFTAADDVRVRVYYVATWHTKKCAPGIKLRVGLGYLIIIKRGMSLFQPKPNSHCQDI